MQQHLDRSNANGKNTDNKKSRNHLVDEIETKHQEYWVKMDENINRAVVVSPWVLQRFTYGFVNVWLQASSIRIIVHPTSTIYKYNVKFDNAYNHLNDQKM